MEVLLQNTDVVFSSWGRAGRYPQGAESRCGTMTLFAQTVVVLGVISILASQRGWLWERVPSGGFTDYNVVGGGNRDFAAPTNVVMPVWE